MIFRVARHTNDLDKIIEFYTQIMGFECLGEFKDHDGYNGVFIGKSGAGWHLEFTTSADNANHKFDPDDLLVFYPESEMEHRNLLNRLHENLIEAVTPKNPYWAVNGKMFLDPDGYGIVISPLRIIS